MIDIVKCTVDDIARELTKAVDELNKKAEKKARKKIDLVNTVEKNLSGSGSLQESERRRKSIRNMRKEYPSLNARQFINLTHALSIYLFE